LWLSSALILFVPEHTLAKLNLKEILTDYGKYIGIIFIISSAFLLVTLFSYLSRQISIRKLRNEARTTILKEIYNLGFHERALLREFYINSKDTLQLPMDNDTVVGLQNKHILYQVSGTGFTYVHGAYFTYAITEFAKENLTLEMIGLPQNPTEQDIERIRNERPTWAKEKSRFEDRFNSRW
jgi:hypothetical protein